MTVQSAEAYLAFHNWQQDGDKIPWENDTTYDGKITVAADAADYAATARDNASVEALISTKKIIVRPRIGTISLEFRFKMDGAENDKNVIKLFAAAGSDHYREIDTLTLDQGIQVYTGTIFFADVVAPVGAKWITSAYDVSPAGSIGSYIINSHSYDRFLFVATTLATTTLYIDWR